MFSAVVTDTASLLFVVGALRKCEVPPVNFSGQLFPFIILSLFVGNTEGN